MEQNDIKNNIDINIRRLSRHYNLCQQKYDDIALLDLSHCLRNWVDLAQEIDNYLDLINIQKKFKSFIVSKQLRRIIKPYDYLIIGFPELIKTYANNGEIIYFPNDLNLPISMNMQIMRNSDKSISIGNLSLIRTKSNELSSKTSGNGIQTKLLNKFSYWLDSDVLKINERGISVKSISRKSIISRVANTLGGSHPINNKKVENKNDELINHLMKSKIGGLPLPYFVLMGISKEILTTMKSI